MNELVQIIVEKTGVSQEKAQLAVESVVSYLKGKLPAVGSQLDALLSSSGEAGKGEGLSEKAKSVVAGLGGLVGKKD